MSLDVQGFLSPEIEQHRTTIRDRHASHVGLFERINRYCQDKKYALTPNNRNGQEVLATCLYIKLLNDVQAVFILSERGLCSQARSMLRVSLDCLIVLGKTCKEHEFFREYIRHGEDSRLRLLNAIRKSPPNRMVELREEITLTLLKSIKDFIGGLGKRNAENWANDVGLSDMYLSTWRLFSGDVHSTPPVVDNYLMLNEEGEAISFVWGPDAEPDMTAEFLEAGRHLLVGTKFIAELFKLDSDTTFDKLAGELNSLSEATPTLAKTTAQCTSSGRNQ
jgi:hypothetical protein